MSWYEKDQPTPFDHAPIPGLCFVDGDWRADRTHRDATRGQKSPAVVFPSGLACDLGESGDPEALGIVHVLEALALPLCDIRDRAFVRVCDIAAPCGYRVRKVGTDRIEVWDQDTGEHVLITYDDALGRMVDLHAACDDAVPPAER